MKKLICVSLALIMIIGSTAFAKDIFVEGEQEACEYLGLSRKELGTMNMAEGLFTGLVAIVRKMKEIEARIDCHVGSGK